MFASQVWISCKLKKIFFFLLSLRLFQKLIDLSNIEIQTDSFCNRPVIFLSCRSTGHGIGSDNEDGIKI